MIRLAFVLLAADFKPCVPSSARGSIESDLTRPATHLSSRSSSPHTRSLPPNKQHQAIRSLHTGLN